MPENLLTKAIPQLIRVEVEHEFFGPSTGRKCPAVSRQSAGSVFPGNIGDWSDSDVVPGSVLPGRKGDDEVKSAVDKSAGLHSEETDGNLTELA